MLPTHIHEEEGSVLSVEKASLELWHHRLFHLNTKAISVLSKHNVIDVIRPDQGTLI